MHPPQFPVSLGVHATIDELARLIEEKVTIGRSIFDDKYIGPSFLWFALTRGCLQRLPDATPGGRLKTAQFAIAADAIDMALVKEWAAHDAIEMRRISFTHFLRPPPRTGWGLPKIQHQCSIVKGSQKEIVSLLSRCGNRKSKAKLPGKRPLYLSAGRCETCHPISTPDKDLIPPLKLNHRRRAVSHLLQLKASPNFLTALNIHRHHTRSVLTTHQTNDTALMVERMGRMPPGGGHGTKIFREIFFPSKVSIAQVERTQPALGSHGNHSVSHHQGCRARSCRITDRILFSIGMAPPNLSRDHVQTVDRFFSRYLSSLKNILGDILHPIGLPIHDHHMSTGQRGARVTTTNGGRPSQDPWPPIEVQISLL